MGAPNTQGLTQVQLSPAAVEVYQALVGGARLQDTGQGTILIVIPRKGVRMVPREVVWELMQAGVVNKQEF